MYYKYPISRIQSLVCIGFVETAFFFFFFFLQQTGHYSLKSVISFAEAGGLDDFAEAEGNSPRDAWFFGG